MKRTLISTKSNSVQTVRCWQSLGDDITLWDANTFEIISIVSGDGEEIETFEFSEDSKFIAFATYGQENIYRFKYIQNKINTTFNWTFIECMGS